MNAQLAAYQTRINQTLDAFLTHHHQQYPIKLAEAVRYATLNNGKRLRPALVYAIGEALNLPLEKLDTAAMAIELIHSYSLVHDDLPAMDNDDLRRGQPTCHIQYNEATAILVGDAQQSLAYECITHDLKLDINHKLKMIQILSQAAGLQGMIGGQFIDISSSGHLPDQETLQKMHQMKTGALIKAALLLGACQSSQFNELTPCLADFGSKIGLAFQVHDDILDIEGTSETLGKPQGSDEAHNKSTYPKLMGLNQAKHYRDTLIQEAMESLRQMNIKSPFLVDLTQYIAKRNH